MADKKIIKKKEKYITERISRKGTRSLEICIRMNGQAFRKSIRIDEFPSRSAAMAFAVKLRDETLVQLRAGKQVTEFPTVKHLYLESYDILPVALKTRYRHDIYFRLALDPYAEMPINKVSSADIQICLNKYAAAHTRQETGKMLAVWRRIYKVAAMKEINVPDRTAAVTLPKGIQPKQKRSKEISQEDLEAFCTALLTYNQASVKGSYDCQAIYYAVRIMQYTGIRPAECFALHRNDIDLVHNTISINKAAHSTETEYLTIGNTKTEQSARIIPVPEGLKPILAECLAWSKHDYFLSRHSGKLPEISWVDTLIGNVRKKCGIDFHLYALRHQFSSDLFSSGTSPVVIRDLMGHESSSMSLDYAVSDKSELEKAINSRKFNKNDE